MTPIYLWVLLGSLSFPLLFSIFYMDLIKNWRHFALSTSIVAIIFLIWDVLFTHQGIWSFNNDYCLGYSFYNMPIEEWLFFYIIPYCSLFIHFALLYAKPNLKLNKKATVIISIFLMALFVLVLITNLSKLYTSVNFIFLIITITLGVIFHLELLQQFFLSFVIILIPFCIVNGILTGGITGMTIVSYNNFENLGIRIGTIPIEDFGYAFTMLFGNLMILESLKPKTKLL